jgi:hypothetical protein
MHEHQYTWAPQVAAALLEINASNLARRIATAERALSERLENPRCSKRSTRTNQRIATLDEKMSPNAINFEGWL